MKRPFRSLLPLLLLLATLAPAQTVLPLTPMITAGGTYSGVIENTAPGVAAVTISTDQPVIITNSVITSRSDAIAGTGTAGLNLTVTNTTSVCYDPRVAGQQRGSFVNAALVSTIDAEHNTMLGCSFGVGVYNSPALTGCKMSNNSVGFAEDRVSSGSGWVNASRPKLGHAFFLASVTAPNGCDVSWNQFILTPGLGSVEDVINVYRSQGAAGHTINVHDNFVQGASSPSNYNGSCGIVDGTSTALSAYTSWTGNQCVGGMGVGFAISNGHDTSMTNGRVVSCGHDAFGNWIMLAFAQAFYIGNDYGQATSTFASNTMSGMTGGLLRPNPDGTPLPANSYKDTGLPPSNVMGPNTFDNPCLVAGAVSTTAEATEAALWPIKLAANAQTVGDQHLQ